MTFPHRSRPIFIAITLGLDQVRKGNDMNFKDHFFVLPALLGGVSGNWIWYGAFRGLVSENGKMYIAFSVMT
jgi:hypothetical protein